MKCNLEDYAMNVIGEIGNFIIKYQEPLQACVIAAIIIAVIIVVIKLLASAKKKREILSQINHTVSEINTAVNQLGEKKTEVIYIDGVKTSRDDSERTPAFIAEQETCAAEAGAEDEAQTKQRACEVEVEAKTEEKIEPSLKYFSRDCGVSKSGKRFTLEELDEQIKD